MRISLHSESVEDYASAVEKDSFVAIMKHRTRNPGL